MQQAQLRRRQSINDHVGALTPEFNERDDELDGVAGRHTDGEAHGTSAHLASAETRLDAFGPQSASPGRNVCQTLPA